MKKVFLLLSLSLVLAGCHESLEKRAAREAREFTEKMCPTPVVNNTRTDSIGFDEESCTLTYYHTFVGPADNKEAINANREQLVDVLRKAVREDVANKLYKEAKFNFRYVYHSQKEPQRVLLDITYTEKDYKQQ